MFEEFYQVPGARRGGTGLGLPYARRLSALLGGELTLASEPGRGTTAVLSLPHGTPSVGTVVVADDDASFRQVVKSMLGGIADRLIEAEDGAQALSAVAAKGRPRADRPGACPAWTAARCLSGCRTRLPAIIITGRDVAPPPRAAALLRKEELTRERLAFAIRRVGRAAR